MNIETLHKNELEHSISLTGTPEEIRIVLELFKDAPALWSIRNVLEAYRDTVDEEAESY